MATCTEKQCSNKLTVMLRVTRGIVCPECTPKAAVAKAAGAGTGASRSGMQIHNRINNPINNPINDLIAKLNGTRKLRNAIYGPIHGPINLTGRGTRATRICADYCAGQLIKKENGAGCPAQHFLIHGAWNRNRSLAIGGSQCSVYHKPITGELCVRQVSVC